MKVTVILFCLLYFFSFSSILFAQDSCHYRISIITLSPGDELYTVFGHSAIRVKDSVSNDDLIYNYGTFDFNEPNFLAKFINGKLMYYVSNEDFLPFIQNYQAEKRTITEQVLNLSCTEKMNIVNFLYHNLQGNNKFYKYDFISDNCTTRLRDLLDKNITGNTNFKRVVSSNKCYRDLLHSDLDYHDHQWIKLGIDILLGSRVDQKMNDKQVMFLPDYLLATIGNASVNNKPLVISKVNLSAEENSAGTHNIILGPLFIFTIFTVLIIYLTFAGNNHIKQILFRSDSLLFFLLGLIGFILLYLWIVSDQLNYSNNYNIIWALPLHIFFAFYALKNNRFCKIYFKITAGIFILLLLIWPTLPQHLNTSLVPIFVLMIFRSIVRGFNLENLYARKNI